MTVRPHDHQIGLQLLGIPHNLLLRYTGVPDHHFDRDLLALQFVNDAM
jgi:hypothetical protein